MITNTRSAIKWFSVFVMMICVQVTMAQSLSEGLDGEPSADITSDAVGAIITNNMPQLHISFIGALLRKSPEFGTDSLTHITSTSVPIIGISPDKKYYQVEYDGQTGWVRTVRGRVSGDLSTVLIVDPNQ